MLDEPAGSIRESWIGAVPEALPRGRKSTLRERAGPEFDGLGWNRTNIMARVPYLNREDLPEADREIFDNLVAERGQPVGNIFRTLAHTPGLLRRFLALGGELRNQTALDPKRG